jgi:hypothetical protein
MRRLLALSLVSVALASCNTRPVSLPGEGIADTPEHLFPQGQNNKADILFMIDTSDSMQAKQDSLKRYFANFMEPLKRLPTPPDLHIGIITSDMGAGPNGYGNCQPGGDRGILQNTPSGTTCATASLKDSAQRFLSYAIDPDLGTPVTNFTGDIADAFSCYASVGTGGCGFEHQLGSVMAALDGCDTAAGCTQKENAGFFREDAYLAIIVLTDEDDCSAPGSSMLFDNSAAAVSTLGPYASYRCFEYGVVCDGVDPGRTEGTRSNCTPGSASTDPLHRLVPVEDIATFLTGLKQDPRMVYLSVIAAPATPVMVGSANGVPGMKPSCTGGLTVADAGKLDRESPAIRLSKLVTLFDADRASFISICADDLKAAMEQVAAELGRIIGNQCLSTPLLDQDTATAGLEPECVVEQRTPAAGESGAYVSATVPPCAEVICDPATAPAGNCKCQRHELPAGGACWYIWSDLTACPMFDSTKPLSEQRGVAAGYQFRIDRGIDAACVNPAAPMGTMAMVQCAGCMANPAEGGFDCTPGCASYWPKCCATSSPTADCLQ